MATSRIFWPKINIFFKSYIKRSLMIVRSFWYYFEGHWWSCVGGKTEKCFETRIILSSRLWRQRWRHSYDQYVIWKPFFSSFLIWWDQSRITTEWRKWAKLKFDVFDSSAPPNCHIDIICIFLEIKLHDNLNARKSFSNPPAQLI